MHGNRNVSLTLQSDKPDSWRRWLTDAVLVTLFMQIEEDEPRVRVCAREKERYNEREREREREREKAVQNG
jgi:hypothetical protein